MPSSKSPSSLDFPPILSTPHTSSLSHHFPTFTPLATDNFSSNFPATDNFSGTFGSTDRFGKGDLGGTNLKPLKGKEGKSAKKMKMSKGFESLGVNGLLLQAINKMGYKSPTPIQKKCLPVAFQRKDVVAMARTGSGKTAAFLIPLLQMLSEVSDGFGSVLLKKSKIKGLVLSPTRELAQQTYSFAIKMSKNLNLKICLLQGGDKIEAQFEALSRNPDIVISTPGRLAHLILELKGDLELNNVEMLIFDEADRLFEMGFQPQLELIVKACEGNVDGGIFSRHFQKMLFSATLPKKLIEFTRSGTGLKLAEPEVIRLDSENNLSENLKLAFFRVRSNEKLAALVYLLTEVIREEEQTIIFVSTRHHLEYLHLLLSRLLNIQCSIAYGTLDMEFRLQNVDDFRKQKTKVLIVTDLAARGLDIPLLNNVINFDFPANVKLFVHRVGRAARQGKSGTAFSLLLKDELPYLFDVSLFLGIKFQEDEQNFIDKSYTIESMTPTDVDLGSFPQEILDSECEKVDRIKCSDEELLSLERSVDNAHKLYLKTRELPSLRSIKRAKTFEQTNLPQQIHPLFKALVSNTVPFSFAKPDTKDGDFVNFASKLKNFRPAETIFEVESKKAKLNANEPNKVPTTILKHVRSLRQEVQSIKRTKTKATRTDLDEAEDEAGPTITTFSKSQDSLEDLKSNEASAVLANQCSSFKRKISRAERKQIKRQKLDIKLHAATISKLTRKKEQNTDFRDPNFFINSVSQQDLQTEAFYAVSKNVMNTEENVMGEDLAVDILPDEDKEIKSKAKSYHWDKRKKRYVKATMDEHILSKRMKNLKNESGNVIDPKNRGQTYKLWQKKTKKRVGQIDFNTKDDSHGKTDLDGVNVRRLSQNMRKLEKENKEQRKLEKLKFGSKNGTEVRNEDQVRKYLKKKEKNKAKNMKGRKKIIADKRKQQTSQEKAEFLKRNSRPRKGKLPPRKK